MNVIIQSLITPLKSLFNILSRPKLSFCRLLVCSYWMSNGQSQQERITKTTRDENLDHFCSVVITATCLILYSGRRSRRINSHWTNANNIANYDYSSIWYHFEALWTSLSNAENMTLICEKCVRIPKFQKLSRTSILSYIHQQKLRLIRAIKIP